MSLTADEKATAERAIELVADLISADAEARRDPDVALPLLTGNLDDLTDRTEDPLYRRLVLALLVDAAGTYLGVLDATVTASGAPLPPWVDLWAGYQREKLGLT